MRRPEAFVVLALALAGCRIDMAEEAAEPADECRIPEVLALSGNPAPPDRKPDPQVDAFVLALSWSPEFCRFRGAAEAHRAQCRDNRFGFILHGLWPQSASMSGADGQPRRCAYAAPLGEATARAHFCMMPSTRLMEHQWRAHGTCSWPTPEAYFAASAKLWEALARPDFRDPSLAPRNVAAIRDTFVALNPGLPRDAIFIDRARNGWLREVRLCLDAGMQYAPCAGGVGAPDAADVSVWRGG